MEKNSYLTKFVNVYIVYDLAAWSRNPTNNFKFNNFLFGTTNIVRNRDKEKYVYSGYGIIFDSGSSWNFDNDTYRSVDSSSSSHVKNCKNSFLILGLGPTFGINGQFGSAKKI